MVSKITGVSRVWSTFVQAQIKKSSKLRVTGICEGNRPVTDGFPSQRASNTGNVPIWWRHHDFQINFTYWDTNQIAAFSRTACTNAFSRVKIIVLWFIFKWDLSPIAIGWNNGVVPISRQVISLTNVAYVLRRIWRHHAGFKKLNGNDISLINRSCYTVLCYTVLLQWLFAM